jgi:osmoprotectant transport system ATP-binding protein
MLGLDNVSKRYGSRTALECTSIEFGRGRTTVLVGPSGCGKSTVLRAIVGLVQPDSGRILIEDEVLTVRNVERVRHRIGYVIQDGGLFPHLTARGNVTLLAHHLRRGPHEIDARVSSLADLVRIAPEHL